MRALDEKSVPSVLAVYCLTRSGNCLVSISGHVDSLEVSRYEAVLLQKASLWPVKWKEERYRETKAVLWDGH